MLHWMEPSSGQLILATGLWPVSYAMSLLESNQRPSGLQEHDVARARHHPVDWAVAAGRFWSSGFVFGVPRRESPGPGLNVLPRLSPSYFVTASISTFGGADLVSRRFIPAHRAGRFRSGAFGSGLLDSKGNPFPVTVRLTRQRTPPNIRGGQQPRKWKTHHLSRKLINCLITAVYGHQINAFCCPPDGCAPHEGAFLAPENGADFARFSAAQMREMPPQSISAPRRHPVASVCEVDALERSLAAARRGCSGIHLVIV
jgi:hypothetical protein